MKRGDGDLRKADEDLKDAEYLFRKGRFCLAAFLCEQAVEKAIKGLYLCRLGFEQPNMLLIHPTNHQPLDFLARQIGVPKRFHPFLDELNDALVDTRYPGQADARVYDQEYVDKIIKKSKEVLEWVKKSVSRIT